MKTKYLIVGFLFLTFNLSADIITRKAMGIKIDEGKGYGSLVLLY